MYIFCSPSGTEKKRKETKIGILNDDNITARACMCSETAIRLVQQEYGLCLQHLRRNFCENNQTFTI